MIQWAGAVTNRSNTAITIVLTVALIASSTLIGLVLAVAMIATGP